MTTKTRANRNERGHLEDRPVPVRTKLSLLWITVMFLYVYVDIFGFYLPGTIEDILVGRVWELDITQGWVVGALALMAVPSLMVFLSVALPARAARWANLVIGALYIPVSLFNLIDETWAHFWVGAMLEVALLVLIVRSAWLWPRATAGTDRAENLATTLPALR
ncbi:MAG: DUF6326 family protein [Acidimicrobiia bacterium]